jgi:hypothetical protein
VVRVKLKQTDQVIFHFGLFKNFKQLIKVAPGKLNCSLIFLDFARFHKVTSVFSLLKWQCDLMRLAN